ncbi:uridine kinase [Pueribacillus theae]|uniref:Uridine kinase n=1 Tax=Pueribacillus theae TaxID=2171751 RepID=A0A2U1K438_9BACI|nr:uridine kinase [Pueribacillus theae]PWA12266.1 uridine kinase [Pueribacillus theae]
MPLNEILQLLKLSSNNRSFVLGIDGLGGAGKTAFAQVVLNFFEKLDIKAIVLHIDDFIYPKNIRYDITKEERYCYYNLQWRYDYLINEILSPIHSGVEINKEIEIYEKINDNYIKRHIKISRDTVVIVEGVFLQRPELGPFFDYVIFIDVPKDVRLKRVINRDSYIGGTPAVKEKYERRYFPAEEMYISSCSPILKANYIIRYLEE